MSEQNCFSISSGFATSNPLLFDLSAYDEALWNGLSEDAAYMDGLEAAAHKMDLAVPAEGLYTEVPHEPQVVPEGLDIFHDHARDSSVHNSMEVDWETRPCTVDGTNSSGYVHADALLLAQHELHHNSSETYPALGNGHHTYPEPPVPSSGFDLASEWRFSVDNSSSAIIFPQESGVLADVASQNPSPPSLVFTSSSPVPPGQQTSTASQDTQPAVRVAETYHWPDTYAGRRSAQAREDYPRECGVCHKRFLYEDSAVKHYRQHHEGPTNIILRYDAPKRPVPGRPRNKKAAKSQFRRGVTPAPAAIQSPPPQTVPSSQSLEAHHPVLTYLADGQPIRVVFAGVGAVSRNACDAIHQPTVSCHPAESYVTSYPSQGATPPHGVITTVFKQPDTDSSLSSFIDPALLATPSAESAQHNRQYKLAIAPFSSWSHLASFFEQARHACNGNSVAMLADQRPLPYLTTSNAPDTAQEALHGLRRLKTATAPDEAQAAIVQTNISLASGRQFHFQEVVPAKNSPQPAYFQADAASGTMPATGMTSPPATLGTPGPQADASTDISRPQEAPQSSYDEQQDRIVLNHNI